MTSQIRMLGMLLLCTGLGYLVWLDNTSDSDTATAVIAETTAPVATGSEAQEITTLEADAPSTDDDVTNVVNSEPDQSFAEDGEDQTDAEAENLNPLSKFEIDILSNTIERPLFASSRQRPPEEAKPDASSENSFANFDLVGVARNGPHATAVLRKQPAGELLRVETGDTFGKWRVKTIEPRSVVLSGADGNDKTIELLRP